MRQTADTRCGRVRESRLGMNGEVGVVGLDVYQRGIAQVLSVKVEGKEVVRTHLLLHRINEIGMSRDSEPDSVSYFLHMATVGWKLRPETKSRAEKRT